MIDLGQFMQGQWVGLGVALPSRADAPPVATLYDDSGASVATVPLVDYSVAGMPDGLYAQPVPVAVASAWGRFRVVFRFTVGGVADLSLAAFTVAGGGDAGGTLIALTSLDRPEARYVLGQNSGGTLVQGRDPYL